MRLKRHITTAIWMIGIALLVFFLALLLSGCGTTVPDELYPPGAKRPSMISSNARTISKIESMMVVPPQPNQILIRQSGTNVILSWMDDGVARLVLESTNLAAPKQQWKQVMPFTTSTNAGYIDLTTPKRRGDSCFYLLSTVASKITVGLIWDPSVDTNVVGYRIYYGPSSRGYTNILDAGNHTNCVVANLDGLTQYYFAATAYEQNGFESEFSDEATCCLTACYPSR